MAKLINVVTKSGIKLKENEEVVDMCKAIMDIKEEGREEGRKSLIIELVKDKMLSISEASKRLDMTSDEFVKIAGLNS